MTLMLVMGEGLLSKINIKMYAQMNSLFLKSTDILSLHGKHFYGYHNIQECNDYTYMCKSSHSLLYRHTLRSDIKNNIVLCTISHPGSSNYIMFTVPPTLTVNPLLVDLVS